MSIERFILNSPFKVVGIVILSLFLFSAVMGSFYVNSEHQRAVVTTMGEFSHTTGPGLQFKYPFVQGVHKADTRLSVIEYPKESTATRDGQALGVTITINHRIIPDDGNLLRLFTDFGERFDYENRLLRNLAIDRIKGIIGKYPMEDFMPKREEIRALAAQTIQDAAKEYGIHIADLQLSDIEFSPRFRERLEDVAEARARAASAEQEKRQAEHTADRAIEEARGRAESERLRAEADAYAVEVSSVATAEAIRREGAARADALKAQNEVLKDNPQGLIELTKAEALKAWDGSSTPQIIIQSGEGGGGTSMIPFMNVGDMLKK